MIFNTIDKLYDELDEVTAAAKKVMGFDAADYTATAEEAIETLVETLDRLRDFIRNSQDSRDVVLELLGDTIIDSMFIGSER